MSQRSLAEWLDYQQRIHPRDIAMGLDRVGEVWRRMGAPRPAPLVISVAGTNGKGSAVAFLEAMLVAAGRRVGSYTSPHLLRYNERVRVLGTEADDAALIDAFERIEAARAEISLTYFEFGTLAAFWIFAHAGLDAAVLEVGLGGRLDAVNLVDADVAVITTIDFDHQDWLGSDLDAIAREKAGILRRDRPGIVGMRDPPPGLIAEAQRIGAPVLLAGVDFDAQRGEDGWCWRSATGQSGAAQTLFLPEPVLAGACQIDNAAAAVTALYALRAKLGWDPAAIALGVRRARPAGRLQRFAREDGVELVVDVAHNPQAARMLAQWLRSQASPRRNLAVFGALADKDVASIVTALQPHVGAWLAAGLDQDSPRGLPVTGLAARMTAGRSDLVPREFGCVADALDAAAAGAAPGDRVIAFGSFFVAAAALDWAQRNAWRSADE